jgi:hypothetical protein
MQQWWPDGVRQERSGWRDEAISARHRHWGFNCPAVDIDFLVVEYNLGVPVALIEFKHHLADPPDIKHASYRAYLDLADNRATPLPFLIVRYWPDIWAFEVTPINEMAKQHFTPGERLCEREFVIRLYRLRRLAVTQHLEGALHTELPPEWER